MPFDPSLLESDEGFDESLLEPESEQHRKIASELAGVRGEILPKVLPALAQGAEDFMTGVAYPLTTLRNLWRLATGNPIPAQPGESLIPFIQEGVSPETIQDYSRLLGNREVLPEGVTEPLAGGATAIANLIGGVTTPEMAPFALAGEVVNPVLKGAVPALFTEETVRQIPEAFSEAGRASVKGTPFEKGQAYTGAALTGAIPLALTARPGIDLVQDLNRKRIVQPTETTKQERKTSYASSQPKSATFYGSLRELPVEGAKEVPFEEGGAGVRENAPEGVAETGEGVLRLNADQAISRVESLPPEEASRLNQKAESYEGITFTLEDVPALTKARQDSQQRLIKATESAVKLPEDEATQNALKAEFGRNIWLSGAIEIANKKGANYEAMVAEKAAKEQMPQVTAPEPVIAEAKTSPEAKLESEVALGLELSGEPIAKVAEPVLKRYFTAKGDLPEPVFQDWVTREGAVREQANVVKHNVRSFYDSLRRAYGIGKTKQALSGFKDIPKEDVAAMNAALKGEVPIESLREPIRQPLMELRNHIDQLSTQMLAEGLIPDKLAAVVGDNLGVYVTRSYRVFDDPKWAEKIPDDIRNRARMMIRERLQDEANQAHERAIEEARSSGGNIETNPKPITEEQTEAVMRSMLEEWRDSGEARTLFGKGAKLGSKDLSLFMRRKDIDPEIRALMGEYDTPVINYVKSISKMSRFVADQTFLNRVRNEGMGKFLFEQPTGDYVAKIAADESRVMSPLNGLYTTREIAKAFREFGHQSRLQNPFWKFLMGLNAASKSAKTVFSLMTQARNLMGQPFFNLMSGHWNFSDYSPSFKAIASDIGLKSDKQFQEYYREMLRRGVAHESAPASELRAAFEDAGLSRLDNDMDAFSGRQAARSLRRIAIDAPERAYAISDELGKIMGFENEKRLVERAHPDWPAEQVAAEAAKRVRNQYPTYSMVPEWIKLWRRQPVFGPFVTFAYETFRTTYHALNQTRAELRSGNPAEKKVGAQRLAGQMAVLSFPFILAALTRSLFGVSEDEEDDLRLFLPHWQRNSKFAYVGREKGGLSFIDLSYLDPYSYLTDPLVAVMSNDDKGILGKTVSGFAEMISPFANEQILSGALIDVMRNQTRDGRPVYNPQDTDEMKFEVSLRHLVRALEPGTVDRIARRILPAVQGNKSETGREYKPLTEIGSEITGIRTQNFDYGQALSYAARKFVGAENEAESIFRSMATRRGSVSDAEILESWKRSDGIRRGLYQQFKRQYDAVIRRGVDEGEATRILRSANVPGNIVGQIRSNHYMPYIPSAQLNRRIYELNHKLPYVPLRDLIQKSQGTILSK